MRRSVLICIGNPSFLASVQHPRIDGQSLPRVHADIWTLCEEENNGRLNSLDMQSGGLR